MRNCLAGFALVALSALPAGADSLVVQSCGAAGPYAVGSTLPDTMDVNGNTCVNPVPGTPFVVSAVGGNSAMLLTIPASSGKYIYITDFSVTGSGATTSSLALVTYNGMSGGLSTYGGYSYDAIIPPGPSQQVDFHRAYTYPWQSAVAGGQVLINVAAFGNGNVNAAARVVGFYQ